MSDALVATFTPRTSAEAKEIDPERKWWLMVGFNEPKSQEAALEIIQADLQRLPDRLEPVDPHPTNGRHAVWCIAFLTGAERAMILKAHGDQHD